MRKDVTIVKPLEQFTMQELVAALRDLSEWGTRLRMMRDTKGTL
jgi:hypothetical protein